MHEAKDEAALLAALPASAHLYAFDERGEAAHAARSSPTLLAAEANTAAARRSHSSIGGADGHSDALRKRARKLIAFGQLTIAHRLVRILVLEQLYRALQDRTRRAVSPRLKSCGWMLPSIRAALMEHRVVGEYLIP